jgi:dolichyl-phosphate beta-glucosyltransferase
MIISKNLYITQLNLPEISIILPYFNKEVRREDLEKLRIYMANNFSSFEIVIVNDGSKNSERILEIAKDLNFEYIELKRNAGKGYAIRTGMLYSKGSKKIFFDFDLPYDLDSISIISGQLNNYDIVIGDRSLKDSQYYKNVNFLKNFLSKLFSSISSGIIGSTFDDTQCGIKGFTENSADNLFYNLKTKGFGFDVEILFLAVKNNYTIKRIPVKLISNKTNIFSYLKSGTLILKDIYNIRKVYKNK